MKEYYATMAQLRLWRRDLNPWEVEGDDDSQGKSIRAQRTIEWKRTFVGI